MLDERPLACANGGDPFCVQLIGLVVAAKTKEAGLQLKYGTAVFDRAVARDSELYRSPVSINPSKAAR